MKSILRSTLLPLHLTFLVASASAAVYTSGHGDLGVGYAAGEFDLHVHLHQGAVVDGSPLLTDTEFEAGDIHIFVPNPSVPRPGNPAFNALGITSGQPLWFLPKSQVPTKPFLGIASEELTPADWTGNIQLRLTAVSGSGVDAGGFVTLWDTDTFGEPEFLWTSFGGLDATDTLTSITGSHAHFNFGFTKPGLYDLTVEATGLHKVDGAISTTGTFQFAVVTPVPEPTTGLWGLTMLGFAATSRLRRRPDTV